MCVLYGLAGDPWGDVADWIERANASGRPFIRATTTLTLALPKTGLLTEAARPHVGELFLANIGVPPELYRRMGLDVGHVFVTDTLVPLE